MLRNDWRYLPGQPLAETLAVVSVALYQLFLLMVDIFEPGMGHPLKMFFEAASLSILILIWAGLNRFSVRRRQDSLLSASLILAVSYVFLSTRSIVFTAKSALGWADTTLAAAAFVGVCAGAIFRSGEKERSGIKTLSRLAELVDRRISVGDSRGTLVLVDIRNFRIINAVFGSDFGDWLIDETAELLKSRKKDGVHFAYAGGIEFCAWFENPHRERVQNGLKEIYSELVTKVRDMGISAVLRVESGWASYPEHGSNFDELYSKANVSMDKAGYIPALSDLLPGQRHQEGLLRNSAYAQEARRAIAESNFSFVYQGKHGMDGGAVRGLEALARWDSKAFGTVSPGVFIPILDEADLSIPFTQMAVEAVLKDLNRIDSVYGLDVGVSLNIPTPFFGDFDILGFFSDVLPSANMAPGRLTLEFREEAFSGDLDSARMTMEALRALGLRIAIDDFGTGFSSLSYLRKLPIQELKIDKSFLDGITDGPKSLDLVGAICEIAHSFDFSVVAEGVETTSQASLLTFTSCDLVQGFAFSRPEALPVL